MDLPLAHFFSVGTGGVRVHSVCASRLARRKELRRAG